MIPIQCEFYALEGVSQLMSTIDIVRRNMNPDLKIEGVILSMFDGRTNLSIQVVEEVKKYFKDEGIYYRYSEKCSSCGSAELRNACHSI